MLVTCALGIVVRVGSGERAAAAATTGGEAGYAAALLFHLAMRFERELLQAEDSAEEDALLNMFEQMKVKTPRDAGKGKAPMFGPVEPVSVSVSVSPKGEGTGADTGGAGSSSGAEAEAEAAAAAAEAAAAAAKGRKNQALLEQLTQSQFGKCALVQLYRVR